MVKKNIDEVSVEEVVEIKNKKPKKMRLKKLSILILLMVAITGVYGSTHYYNKYKALKTNANVEAEKETNRLVGILGKLMELPQGEMPTVATISDKEKLKGQAFFDKAENGDILFAYTNAMKAILYRPSANKIINVAPISINQTQDVAPAMKKAPVAPSATTTKR
jgi:hypothetical protein